MNILSKILYGTLMMCLLLTSCEKKEKNLYKKIKHSEQLVKIKGIADNFFISNDIDSSYYYFNKLKQHSIKQKDTSYWIYSLVWTAQIQTVTEDYTGSESTLTEALSIVENTNKYPHGKYGTYLTLGNNYLENSEYKQALIYYRKSHETSKLLTLDEKATSQSNIALVHIKTENYLKAKEILLLLLSKKNMYPYPITYAHIINNLGYCYLKLGDSVQSLKLLTKSLKISLEENDELACINSYINLSEYYHSFNPKLADQFTLKAHQIAKKKKFYNEQLILLKLLIKNNTGNKSKEYALEYLKLNDSITKIRQKSKNQFAKIKYDFKKEKEENEILKTQRALEQEQQKNKNLFFYFIITIGLLSTLLIYYYLVTKNKKEKINASYNTEVRIAKKLHDELANDVYHTMAFAETQDLSSHSNKEKLLHNLDTIYSRTRNISKENSLIATDDLFVPNLKEMMLGFNTYEVNILTNGIDTINWKNIASFKKITIYRVLQELLVNMKKHSHSSIVVLSFEENNKQIIIKYTDNGIGAMEEQLISKNGLKNAENRILAINGNITFETKDQKGFKVNISFPI